MTSPFGKYMWSVTVPAGGWVFDTSRGPVTVAAGSYASPLELGKALKDALNAGIPALTWHVHIAQYGIASIEGDAVWATDWPGTTPALRDALGFLGSESVDGANALTGSRCVSFAYHPGAISWGYDQNEGCAVTRAWTWEPQWRRLVVRQTSLIGARTGVGPASSPRLASLQYGHIRQREADDDRAGLLALRNACAKGSVRWYPDRSKGVVGTPGVQDTDFYVVVPEEDPEARVERAHFWSWSVTWNREPTP